MYGPKPGEIKAFFVTLATLGAGAGIFLWELVKYLARHVTIGWQ
jgi:hypothetical protein